MSAAVFSRYAFKEHIGFLVQELGRQLCAVRTDVKHGFFKVFAVGRVYFDHSFVDSFYHYGTLLVTFFGNIIG